MNSDMLARPRWIQAKLWPSLRNGEAIFIHPKHQKKARQRGMVAGELPDTFRFAREQDNSEAFRASLIFNLQKDLDGELSGLFCSGLFTIMSVSLG